MSGYNRHFIKVMHHYIHDMEQWVSRWWVAYHPRWVPEKHHSVLQLATSPAQLLPSILENRQSSRTPSNFRNPDNNQEIEVNTKGC